MTHKLHSDVHGDLYGYIMADPFEDRGFGDLSQGFIIDTLTGVSLPTDARSDLTAGFYLDMLSSFGVTTPIGGYSRYVEMEALSTVSHFYQQGDTDGTPTATRLPTEITPFARVSYNAGSGFEFTLTVDRSDGSVVYSSSAHTLTPFASYVDVVGPDLHGDAGFMADVQGANTLRVAVTADAPADGYWRLYSFGFRYPLITTTSRPPLRQWPRDDGLRRTPRGTTTSSRQGSLRRGPRGNYT